MTESAASPLEPRIQQHLAAVLESAGVNRDFIVKAVTRIDSALDATRTSRMHVGGGEIVENVDVDHSTRLSASDRALDLASRAGLIPGPSSARHDNRSGPQLTVNIVVLGRGGEKEVVSITSEAER